MFALKENNKKHNVMDTCNVSMVFGHYFTQRYLSTNNILKDAKFEKVEMHAFCMWKIEKNIG